MSKSQKRVRSFRHAVNFNFVENFIFMYNFAKWQTSTHADDYGDSKASFMRYVTIGDGLPKLRKKRRIVGRYKLPEEKLLLQLLAEMNKIGNNLNQLTHQGWVSVNSGGKTPTPCETKLEQALDTVISTSQSIRIQLRLDPKDNNNP